MGAHLGLLSRSEAAYFSFNPSLHINLQKAKVAHATLGENLDHGATIVHAADWDLYEHKLLFSVRKASLTDKLAAGLWVDPAP